MLKEQIARIKIPGGKKNPDLESLMDSILTTDRDQQETNLKMLNTYLEKWKNEQDEKERKREEAENKKEEGRGPLSKTIHKVVKSLIPPMMKTFEFILYVLDKTIFIASELTFQTHYEVALKGILLLQTVHYTHHSYSIQCTDSYDRHTIAPVVLRRT
jgi:hypothetical protein